MAAFQPGSISIAKPNIRVRSEAGRAAEAPEGVALKIWKIADPADISTPVSVDVTSSKRIEFLVDLEPTGEKVSAQKYTLSAKFVHNTTLTFETTTFDQINKPISIYLNGWDNARPWGINSKIIWYIAPDYDSELMPGPTSDQYAVKRTTPLELYAITPKKFLPEFFKHEAPVEILRIFILPTMTVIPTIKEDEDGKMASYIKYATAVCHRSKMDETAKTTTDLGEFNPVHSYQYCTLNGSSHFRLQKTGGHFPIKEWIKQRFHTTSNKVNCYDQAALLQVVGSLGITGESTKLVWNYVWPYGFIRETDLVGWGKCNSPYYPKNHGDNYGPRILNATSSEREGFKNHAFITMGTGDDCRFLDACAGPHFGNENKKQYIKAARDFNHPKPPPEWLTGEGYNWEPLDDNIMEVLPRYGVLSLQHEATATRSHLPDNTLFEPPENHSAAMSELHDKSAVKNTQDEECIHVGLKKLDEILVHMGFKTELDSSNDEGTRSLRWESLGGAWWAVVEMEVYRNKKGAINAWNTFFHSHSRSYHEVFEKPAPENQKGNNNLVVVRGVEQDVWRRGNVFIKVNKGPGDSDVEGIVGDVARQIDDYLKEAPTKMPREHEFDDIQLFAGTSTPRVGVEFTVQLNTNYAVDVKPVIKNHNVFLVADPEQPGDGKWLFTFRAISEGAEFIQFICSHNCGCQVKVTQQNIHVLPKSS